MHCEQCEGSNVTEIYNLKVGSLEEGTVWFLYKCSDCTYLKLISKDIIEKNDKRV